MSTYQVQIADRLIDVDSVEADKLDLVSHHEGRYHLLHKEQSYRVELLGIDRSTKTVTLEVNGTIHTAAIKDQYDQLVEKMGLEIGADHTGGDIMAPMPGLVLQVLVAVGDTVEEGTPLLLLEAMKMENIIKADGHATVESIEITTGQAVEKGQLLITMSTDA